MKLFYNKEVTNLLGLSFNALRHYVQIGLIIPEVKAVGRGGRHGYSFENFLEIIVARQFFKLSLAKLVLSTLRRHNRRLSECYFLCLLFNASSRKPVLYLLKTLDMTKIPIEHTMTFWIDVGYEREKLLNDFS